MTQHFDLIATLRNSYEAGYLVNELKVREIPHGVEPLGDTAFAALLQPAQGWGRLYAPSECREIISELITEFRSKPFNETNGSDDG